MIRTAGSDHPRLPKGRIFFAAFAAGVGLLAALPLWINPFLNLRFDSLLHASIANAVVINGIPPVNPFLAGEPLVYPWLHDAIIAVLSSATGILPFSIWPLWSGLLAAGLSLTFVGIARSMNFSQRASFFAALLGIFGINGLGLLIALPHPNSLFFPAGVVPLVRSTAWYFDPRLAGLLTKFFVYNPFPFAVLLFLAVLYQIIRFLGLAEKEEKLSGWFRIAVTIMLLVALGSTQMLVCAAACAAIPPAAIAVLLTLTSQRKIVLRKIGMLLLPFLVSGLIVVTWQLPLMRIASFSHVSIANPATPYYLANCSLPLLIPLALVISGAVAFGVPVINKPMWIFFITVAIVCEALSFLNFPDHNEYKFIYLAGIAMAFPAAQAAAAFWDSQKWLIALPFAICIVSGLGLAVGYARVPETYRYTSEDLDLGRWIDSNTPSSAIFVERPARDFQIVPVLGKRQLLVGFIDALLIWGYNPKEIAARYGAAFSLVTNPDPRLASSIGVRYIVLDRSAWPRKNPPTGFRTVYSNRRYLIFATTDSQR